MTAPGFLALSLPRPSPSTSAGKFEGNPDASAPPASEAAGADFSAQLGDLIAQLNSLPENPPSSEGLESTGGQTRFIKNLLSLEQKEGEEVASGLESSLPVPAVTTTEIGSLPAWVETSGNVTKSQDLPQVGGPESDFIAKNSALTSREVPGLAGIVSDASKPTPPPLNTLSPEQPQLQLNQRNTPTPEISTQAGSLQEPVLEVATEEAEPPVSLSPAPSKGTAPLTALAPEGEKEAANSALLEGDTLSNLSLKGTAEKREPPLPLSQPGSGVNKELASLGLLASQGKSGVENSASALQGESGAENPILTGGNSKLNPDLDISIEELESQGFQRQGHSSVSQVSPGGGLSAVTAPEHSTLLQGETQRLAEPTPLREMSPPLVSQASLGPNPMETAAPPASVEGSRLNLNLEAALQQPQWGEELSERMTWLIKDKVHIAELRLNPPQLGPLEARINLHHEEASITFHASQAAVREALEAALPRLRDALAEQGLSLVNVDVSQQGFSEQQRQSAQSGNLRATPAESTETDAQEGLEKDPRPPVPQGGVDYYA
ncbi:flagellar hook-length control protein [Nitrosococcus halophilus Nc 4]|uniref:Flagellar hook-length control protein n=1 Tax=Nitrosococcus halophilus (strain Nc4) TaxID=472759 RepID=D5BV88_NITHN|nr:flagellar hook-length control protein FliK [Nitrosococcus halophilus]ADE15438.1 flagellar hook-length control protein [Nitrosococcus halophilus Nc 4]